jgi:hypothetical protein
MYSTYSLRRGTAAIVVIIVIIIIIITITTTTIVIIRIPGIYMSSNEVQNSWSYTSISPYAFMAWYLIKQRASFTLPHFYVLA